MSDSAALLEELRHGQRHTPSHVYPPHGLAPISELFANEIDQAIFETLGDFAEVANHFLEWGSWTLEQMAETELSDSDPSYGRRMRLYFNRAEVGEVDIQPGFGASIQKTMIAQCSVVLSEAQHIPYGDVQGLLTSLGYLVMNDDEAGVAQVRDDAREAMRRFLWGVMVDPDYPEPLQFRAEGGFGFFLVRQQAFREDRQQGR